jgi:fumarate hydratase class II
LRTGIEPNYKRITELVDNSLMLVTALNTKDITNQQKLLKPLIKMEQL